ncbi:MAG: glycoside hydrolase family 3 N-terminal domain-containing protein [Bdellovibrionia bacterium]
MFSSNSLAKGPLKLGKESLSVEAAAGQLMMVGIGGTAVDKKLAKHLRQIKPGSIILFKRNLPSAVSAKKFTASLQNLKINQLPLIIAIDQEGGDVVRLQTQPPMPSAYSLASSMDNSFIRSYSERISEYMQSAGINMNLAPVLDLADPKQISFLGARSFGNNAALVGQAGLAFAEGHIANFVVPVAKHFPGMGHTSTDPHFSVGKVNLSLEHLLRDSVVPFASFSGLGRFTGMMMSHFVYPAIDDERPASLSQKNMSLLRDRLKYKGLIITDDLQMDAVKSQLALEDAAVLSLKAGADIVMVAYSPKAQLKVRQRIVRAIQKGELSTQEVQEKLQRISFVKEVINKAPKTTVPRMLALRNFSDFDNDLLKKKISKISRAPSSESPKNKFCLLSDVSSFRESFRASVGKKKTSTVHFKDLKDIKSNKISSCDLFVLAVSRKDSSAQLKNLNTFILEKSLIVNLGLPALTAGLESYQVVNLDFPHAQAGKKIAQLLK